MSKTRTWTSEPVRQGRGSRTYFSRSVKVLGKSPSYFICPTQCQSKLRCIFRKISWPSQNILTLTLSQPGGQIMHAHYYSSPLPQIFRPSDNPARPLFLQQIFSLTFYDHFFLGKFDSCHHQVARINCQKLCRREEVGKKSKTF